MSAPKGKPSWNKGKRLSDKHKQLLSLAHRGKTSWLGRRHSSEARARMRRSRLAFFANGGKPWNYVEDRTDRDEKHRLRGTDGWKLWREQVFALDAYTCQECHAVGGYLEPHHIIPLRVSMETKFDIKNGITLCRPCHRQTVWKESDYQEKYLAIVAARK